MQPRRLWTGQRYGHPALFVERLDAAFELDQHGPALAVQCLAGGNLDPAFADAVFLDVVAFLVVQANADLVFEHGGDMVRAGRVDRQVVGQVGALGGLRFGHVG